MSRPIKVAIAGLGNRGRDNYAKCAKLHPDKMEIAAVADIDPKKVELVAEEYHLPKEACFASAEEMLKQEKLADVMIIATQDRQHVGHAVAALEKGYHLLLEKPVSPEADECRRLADTAKRCGRKGGGCHVLRYTPIYQKVKELLDEGVIGDVVSIMASENVGWYHQAHSFVRGNWANSKETSPMILQKCCHDMDLYLWLADKKCESLTSYGDTYLFKKENAPKGCAARCLDGCGVKEDCPFDAEKIAGQVLLNKRSREKAEELLTPLVREVCETLGDVVYGVDVGSLEEVVSGLLAERGLTLAAAESCTGGLLSKRMTDLPGASKVFRGGVVSYVNDVKANVLGVPREVLEQYGAVSEETARAMAEGCRRVCGSDLAVSVTGVPLARGASGVTTACRATSS